MKRAGFIIIALLAAGAVFGQQDPKAREILDKMSQKYQNLPSFKTNFVYRLDNKVENISEEFAGEIMVKGEKYVLLMGDQEVYNDGETLWTYLKDANEVNIDNYEPDEGDLSPGNIYNAYKKGYRYRWLETKKAGSRTLDVIELQPENPNDSDKMFYKIVLNIDKTDHSIHSWEMYDRAGNRYSYTISGFDPGFRADDSFFRFDESKYPGVEVVDLR